MFGLFDDPFDCFPSMYSPYMNRRKILERMLYDPFFGLLYDDEESEEQQKLKKEEKTQEEESKPNEEDDQVQEWSRESIFSSHARGGLEEVREKSFDSKTGETHEIQTRRIGDRWVQVDTITTKDGHTVSKETWHNVSTEQQEEFKLEWIKRQGGKKAIKEEFKALKNDEKKPKEQ